MNATGIILFFLIYSSVTYSQRCLNQTSDTIPVLQGEKWFGAAVDEGIKMPFEPGYSLDLYGDCKGNQAAPLLLSTKGRFIWNDEPFYIKVNNDNIIVRSCGPAFKFGDTKKDLASAYKEASRLYFPPSGQLPDAFFVDQPQYNTWIELKYNQSQSGILGYAHDIIKHGLPPGIIMIDDNWFPSYGAFEFRKDRFEDAVSMIRELHALGFKVMVWVSPFISPDTEVFRELSNKNLLVHRKNNSQHELQPAIINWWNGFSASVDLTNPAAFKWFEGILATMKSKYGIDGFKFDAGDPEFYSDSTLQFHKAIGPNDFTALWAKLGLGQPFNEYRATWKQGNQPLVQRLRDKRHSWEDLQKIIPAMTVAGLLGYGMICPDMIGGGEFLSFGETDSIDHRLIIRSAQLQSLMPMMQFSIAPWRVLNENEFKAIQKAVDTRAAFLPVIRNYENRYAKTGEPIVRSLEYVFPGEGFAACKDQFMLGDSILVAPVLTSSDSRSVKFPAGVWKAYNGRIIKGPQTMVIPVELNELPWFALKERPKRKSKTVRP